MFFIFFSEENVNLEILPPYLHKTELQNHGVISTGEFNISRWFRPINFEFLLWENEKLKPLILRKIKKIGEL